MSLPQPIFSLQACLATSGGGALEQPIALDTQKDFTLCARARVLDQKTSAHCACLSLELPGVANSSVVWLGFMWERSSNFRVYGTCTGGGTPPTCQGKKSFKRDKTEWTHVALAFSAEQRVLKLFVDGVLEGDTKLSSPLKSGDGTRIAVGRGLWDGKPTDFWAGSIEKVKVWNVALADADIAQECRTSACACYGELSPIPPLCEPGVRSVFDDIRTTITFVNCRAGAVALFLA